MALNKKIELPNGVTVNYHRIVSVNNVTNQTSLIEVGSYTSKAKRDEEKQALLNNAEMNVFIHTEKLAIPYDSTLDVINAYEYLKTTEKYEGAKNA